MLRVKIFITSIILMTVGLSQAQVFWGENFKVIDSTSYQAYLDQDWEKVIEIGTKALKFNTDYYYLRMRMGAAYYQLGQLPKAGTQYEKALMLNKNDPTAQIYLYNTYLYLGKKQKAYRLSTTFTQSTANLVAGKMKGVESVVTGGGVSLSNNFSRNESNPLLHDSSSMGQQTLFGDKRILFAGAQFNLSPITSLYLGYNNLLIDKRTRINYVDSSIYVNSTRYEDWGFQRTFTEEGKIVEKTFDNQLRQNELYLSVRFQFENGWAGSLFGNFLLVNTDVIKMDTQRVFFRDTTYYVINTGDVELKETNYLAYHFKQRDTSFVNYLFGAHLEKDYNNLTVGFTAIASALNGLKQNQLSLDAFYFLGKGTRFYGKSEVSWFVQKWDAGNENRYFFKQSLGHQLYKLSWLEAEYVLGNQNNASTLNGMVVFNQADKMNYRAGVSFIVMPINHLELSLRYQYISFEGYSSEMYPDEENIKTHTFAYEAQNFLGGIKWTF